MSEDGTNTNFLSEGFTVDEVAAAVARIGRLPLIPGEERIQERLSQNELQAALANVRRAAAETVQALEPLIEAINEFGRVLGGIMRRIAEAIAEAITAAFVKSDWLLATAGLEGWWSAYANYSRSRLRQVTDRWRLLRRPAGYVVDRLPDRVAVFLFREVYLRWF